MVRPLAFAFVGSADRYLECNVNVTIVPQQVCTYVHMYVRSTCRVVAVGTYICTYIHAYVIYGVHTYRYLFPGESQSDGAGAEYVVGSCHVTDVVS